eukprot:gene25930-11609_t
MAEQAISMMAQQLGAAAAGKSNKAVTTIYGNAFSKYSVVRRMVALKYGGSTPVTKQLIAEAEKQLGMFSAAPKQKGDYTVRDYLATPGQSSNPKSANLMKNKVIRQVIPAEGPYRSRLADLGPDAQAYLQEIDHQGPRYSLSHVGKDEQLQHRTHWKCPQLSDTWQARHEPVQSVTNFGLESPSVLPANLLRPALAGRSWNSGFSSLARNHTMRASSSLSLQVGWVSDTHSSSANSDASVLSSDASGRHLMPPDERTIFDAAMSTSRRGSLEGTKRSSLDANKGVTNSGLDLLNVGVLEAPPGTSLRRKGSVDPPPPRAGKNKLAYGGFLEAPVGMPKRWQSSLDLSSRDKAGMGSHGLPISERAPKCFTPDQLYLPSIGGSPAHGMSSPHSHAPSSTQSGATSSIASLTYSPNPSASTFQNSPLSPVLHASSSGQSGAARSFTPLNPPPNLATITCPSPRNHHPQPLKNSPLSPTPPVEASPSQSRNPRQRKMSSPVPGPDPRQRAGTSLGMNSLAPFSSSNLRQWTGASLAPSPDLRQRARTSLSIHPPVPLPPTDPRSPDPRQKAGTYTDMHPSAAERTLQTRFSLETGTRPASAYASSLYGVKPGQSDEEAELFTSAFI